VTLFHVKQPRAGEHPRPGTQPLRREQIVYSEKEQKIVDSFKYNASDPDQRAKYEETMGVLQAAAEKVIQIVPDCADRTTALRCLREARMWANAAINLKGSI
jgi:hypothetical protein